MIRSNLLSSSSRALARACLVVASLAAVGAVSAADPLVRDHYHVLSSVRLSGSDGWDYITLDPLTRRLYITRNSHVMVVSADRGTVLGDIDGLQHVHGVALVGTHGYITDGGADALIVFDRQSLRKIGRIAVGKRPDGILYDPVSQRLFAFNADSHDATAIDVHSDQVVGTVSLGGKPESAAADRSGLIYVNIEDKSELVAFDGKRLALLRRWSLAPCSEPSGLAMDVAHARLFSGCDNAMLAVSDAQAGKVVSTVPIGEGVDANRFDPMRQLIFSSNGESGTLTVVHEDSPDQYHVVENVPTARSARTMELDPKSHRVYVVAAEFRPVTATAAQPHPRPTAIAGTFRLITVAP